MFIYCIALTLLYTVSFIWLKWQFKQKIHIIKQDYINKLYEYSLNMEKEQKAWFDKQAAKFVKPTEIVLTRYKKT